MLRFKNKKTGDIYVFLANGIDCTNSRDGSKLVIYVKNVFLMLILSFLFSFIDYQIYVRDKDEFNEKFEPLKQD